MTNRHIMITGGMGFIGHALAKLYLNDRFKVTVVDNLYNHYAHAALTKYRMEQLNSDRLNFIQLNCSQTYSINEKISKIAPRTIIHLANPSESSLQYDKYIATSSMSANALTIAELAKELNARLVFVSSSMVYGNFTQNQLCESQPRDPVELPGILKSHCEDITKFACKNTVIIRPSAVYGPGDHSKHIFHKWIVSALDNKPILVENPSPQFDFTHVDDVVKGIKIIEENGQAGEAYNLSYGKAHSLSDAVLLIKKITSSKSEVDLLDYNLNNASSFPKSGSLNISKAQELGYRPKMDLFSGLKNYVDWIERYSHLN